MRKKRNSAQLSALLVMWGWRSPEAELPYQKTDGPIHQQHPIIRYNDNAHFEGDHVPLSMMKGFESKVVKTVADVLQREKIPNSVKKVKYVVRSKCLHGDRLDIFATCGNPLAGIQVKEILVKIPKGSICKASVPIVIDTSSK